MEIMHVIFLKEVLFIKGLQGRTAECGIDASITEDKEIYSAFEFYLRLREHLFAINRSLILLTVDLPKVARLMAKDEQQGTNFEEFVSTLMGYRKAVRSRLLSLWRLTCPGQ